MVPRTTIAPSPGESPIQSLSTLTIIYCCVVMIAAYAVRGTSGFGAAAALPLLALVLPLKILVPAWTLIALAAGTALLGSDRNKIAWAEVVKLLPGTAIGIVLGLYVFKLLSSEALDRWVGGFVMAYGLYSLWTTFGAGRKPYLAPRVAALIGGIAGGMTGTVVGTMGSAFYAIYFDVIKLGKDNYRATMTAILLTLSLGRGAGYFAVGEFGSDVVAVTAFLLPSMLIGIFIGNRFHHGMSDTVFRRTVACALAVSGAALLIK